MDIKYKIENIRDCLNDNELNLDYSKKFFNAILDMLEDISKEIDEINELIQFSKNYSIY